MNASALVLKLVVAAFAATIAFHSGLEAKAAEGQRIVIEIRGFKFVPERPAVSPGDVVVWRNMDIVPHTVTAQGDSWDSGLIKAGEEWETEITGEMVPAYYCRFHPSMIAALGIEPKSAEASARSFAARR